MRSIVLANTGEVSINPKINALIMKKLRDEEGFKTKLLINSFVKKEDIDEMVLVDSVFLAYRQANPNGLSYEKFLEEYEFDFEEATEVFAAVISKKGKQRFAEGFKKKTPKKQKAKKHHKSK